MESSPRSGPTVLSSKMFYGAGKAPDLRSKAKSVADWNVKFPEIWPVPPNIGSLICGALIILLSKIIAKRLPTFLVVALPNFLEPTLSKVKLTTVSLFVLSKEGLALVKFSPLRITLLFIFNSVTPSSKNKVSDPKASSSSDTNLKLKFAVLPNKFLILLGSSRPGSSINILSFPLLIIVGSLVPTSSILLLTISNEWSSAEFFISIRPYLEYEIEALFFSNI